MYERLHTHDDGDQLTWSGNTAVGLLAPPVVQGQCYRDVLIYYCYIQQRVAGEIDMRSVRHSSGKQDGAAETDDGGYHE